jgi:hypothetical protein
LTDMCADAKIIHAEGASDRDCESSPSLSVDDADDFSGAKDFHKLSERSMNVLALMTNRFGGDNIVRYTVFCERYPGFPAMVTYATPEQLRGIALHFSSHSWKEMFRGGNERFIRIMHRCCEKNDENYMTAMRMVCAKAAHRCGNFFTWNPKTLEFCELSILSPAERSEPGSRIVLGDDRDQPVFRDTRVVLAMHEALRIIRAPGHIPHNFAEIESWEPIFGVAHGLEVGARVYHVKGKGAVDIVRGGGVKIRCEMSLGNCTAPMRCKPWDLSMLLALAKEASSSCEV